MKVVNRKGEDVSIEYNAVKDRIAALCSPEELEFLDIDDIVIHTIQGIHDKITTTELDQLSARICANMQSTHYLYGELAGRIAISDLQKNIKHRFNTSFTFSKKMAVLWNTDMMNDAFTKFVLNNEDFLDNLIDYKKDSTLNFFAVKTLEKSYLMKVNDVTIETPQDMFMRVAVAVHADFADIPLALQNIKESYELMSNGYFTHATPTLFNAGTKYEQMSSCFLENTRVVTVNSGIKPIQEISIGDLVVTHKGNIKPVTQLHRNLLGDRNIHRLKVSQKNEIFVTDNHRFWAVTKSKIDPSWTRIDELCEGDYINSTVQEPIFIDQNNAKYINGKKFLRIESNTIQDDLKPEYVYTLGVKDDHSYNVEGLLAENCYLMGIEDSMSGIYKLLGDCAQISKWAGGIGIHISNIRSRGSRIKSTNGTSDGIIPMLKVFNETARYSTQGGRRKGSIAVYLEPWHADVWDFLDLRKNTGAETERARDLFQALWVPDLFMKCVEDDLDWFLMSPDICPGLNDLYGKKFESLYTKYVLEGKFVRKMKAQELWQHILEAQFETGMPYVLFKDHVNCKSNQMNVGIIKSSNLCAEITEYSDSSMYSVCNLASIAVNRFFDPDTKEIDHEKLHEVAKVVCRNLNKVIDINFYPTKETYDSNMMLRPIGIGIQGLGDLYCLLDLPYDHEDAIRLDAELMETIYHGALEASMELSSKYGPYNCFRGSPFSQGKFQFDLWIENGSTPHLSGRYDWKDLREKIRKNGTRNSLLTALMPTASTSQILGNSEMFEPYSSNIFKRTTLSGEFMIVNKHLMKKLMDLKIWNDDVKEQLMLSDGSVQDIDEIPQDIKDVFRTVWEVRQRSVIDHAVARGPFVDQSQSQNLFFAKPNFTKLHSALMYAWKKGLKTGVYYTRSSPAREAKRVGIEKSEKKEVVCAGDTCEICSS
jgi:ribonucleoside-diphosphate reductase alpha chain